MIGISKTGIRRLRGSIAILAIFVLLVLGVVEPAHVHKSTRATAHTPCVLCVLGHSTAPAHSVSLEFLTQRQEPNLQMVRFELHHASHYRSNFIRPPPALL